MKHRIEHYGRWLFFVTSASRKGVKHLVDLEPELTDYGHPDPEGRMFKCDCEADKYAVERPCRHVRAVAQFIKPVLEFYRTMNLQSFNAIPTKPKRKYQLKTDETTTTNPTTPERRLRPRMHSQPA